MADEVGTFWFIGKYCKGCRRRADFCSSEQLSACIEAEKLRLMVVNETYERCSPKLDKLEDINNALRS